MSFDYRDGAIALSALGVAGIAWALVTTDIMAAIAWLPLLGGVVLLVAGLSLAYWNRKGPPSKPR